MAVSLDIGKVIDRSTSQVSLEALKSKGFNRVKVLNQATITRLITEAVDLVMSERAQEISSAERQRVIEESRTQFEELAKRQTEASRGRVEVLEQSNEALREELATLAKRFQGVVQVQAERDQALDRVKQLEEAARQHVSLVEEKQKELISVRASLEACQRRGEQGEERITALVGQLQERERQVAELHGELESKKQELDRGAASEAGLAERLLGVMSEKLQALAGSSNDMQEIKRALSGLQSNIKNLSVGGVGSRAVADLSEEALVELAGKAGDVSLETNVSKVKVKQATSKGVGESLARLRKMHKRSEQ